MVKKKYDWLGVFKTTKERFLRTMRGNETQDSFLNKLLDLYDRISSQENGTLKDPIQGLFSTLTSLKQTHSDLTFQDFELSGALMRLQLLRPKD